MYKYLTRINVFEIDEEGRSEICRILDQDKGKRTVLSTDNNWYYVYLEYETIQEADNLVNTLLKIKEIQNRYPHNNHVNECFIVTNKLTL